MYTTITASSRFKIYAAVALAALLMTMLAVTLATGQAQATTITNSADSGDDNLIPQQQGQAATTTPLPHKTPEACPAEGEAASVVDRGHYALFDVYWNPVEEELTNNICPPLATYTREQKRDEFGDLIPGEYIYMYTRSPSSINITAEPPTIIHIPRSAKINLSDSTTYGNRTYAEMYPQVVTADNKENRPNAEGTPVPGMGDGIVWALPACPPDGASDSSLCLSFSAALLNSADWLGSEVGADATIDYLVHHVHQVDIDKQDPRYVLAYDVPATDASVANDPLWNSSDARKDTVTVAPGGYNRPLWFFTDRGTYEFQVNIRGYPNTKITNPESEDGSVSSDVREYIVHVGAEADLGVTTAVAPESTAPSSDDTISNVTITITASNAGPDTAEKTKVDVALPEGLTYSSDSTATGTYADGVWSIGEFANGASATLTITATVDAETHGKKLDVKATISATETVAITEGTEDGGKEIVEYGVPVPDPTPGNDTATGTTTVASDTNVAPMFIIARSVPENSAAGTYVGTPVLVKNPESSDTLTFTLSGDGIRNFTVEAVDGGAQIKVAELSYLNYEDTVSNSYDLTLQVSDGKDSNGNVDDSVDDTIPVRVTVDDVSEPVGITLTADPSAAAAGQYITLEASLGSNPPAARGEMDFVWVRRSPNSEIDWRDDEHGSGEDFSITYNSAGVKQYAVFAKYFDRSALVVRTVESTWVEVTWTE